MILVADFGTSFLKAGLVDCNGTLVSVKKLSFAASSNEFTDTSVWLKAFSDVLDSLCVKERRIDCIILSGNGPTLAPSCGGKAFLYGFNGAEEEATFIREKTGLSFLPSMFLPKALYIKNRLPELWNRAQYFFSTPEFISFKLTGVARTVLALEGLEKWYWNDELLKALNLNCDKFPPFIKTGEFLGEVTAEASALFGLKAGTPVLAGCPDFVCAIIGSGAMHPTMLCNRSGSSEGINYCAEKPVKDPYYMCYRHPNGKDWNISAVISRGFIELDKLMVEHGFSKMSYEKMFEYLKTQDGADSQAIKSFCIKLCNEVGALIKKVADGPVSEIRITGGPSASDYLNQLKADITGTKVSVPECSEVGLSGLGILALSSLNRENITEVADRVVQVGKTYLPSEKG